MSRKPAAAHSPRFRAARRALPELAQREAWTRTEVDRWQLAQLQKTWTHAITHVPHYRDLQRKHELPLRFDDLDHFTNAVPILDKETVRAEPMRLRSEQAGRGAWHTTSGSSGTPTAVFRSHAAHRAALRVQYRFQQSWGVDFDGRWAHMWGNADALAGGLRGLRPRITTPIFDRLRGRLRISPYQLGADDLSRALDRMVAYAPQALYTHSMAGHLLAIEAQRRGVTIPSLRLIVLTAEPVRRSTVTVVEKAFDVPAVAEYGCNEAGLVAGEARDRTLRVRDDHVRVETLKREDRRHDLVISVLDNPDFPLLRYAVGDVTTRPIQRPDSGFSILHDVAGREFDLLVASDGSIVHAQAVEDIIDKFDAVRRWQLRQQRDASVRVEIEVDGHFTADSGDRIGTRITDLLKGVPVDVAIIDEFPPITQGKHRVVTSELSATTLRSPNPSPDDAFVAPADEPLSRP